MSLPLTVRPRLTLSCGGCPRCGEFSTQLLTLTLGRDSLQPICIDCMVRRGPLEEPLVLDTGLPKPGARAPTRAMKKKSQRREQRIAESIGGRAQPASGSLPHAKGDVRKRGEWRVQDKTSRNKGFDLTRQLISEIRSQCAYGEKFAITIGFLNPLTQKEEDEVVVIDRYAWEEMTHARVDH